MSIFSKSRKDTFSPIVVFSHLRWNFVYQRPQHVISRLALRWPVFFIEEPVRSNIATAQWDRREAAPNVTVLVPLIPEAQFTPGWCGMAMHQLIQSLALTESLLDRIVWTYTPAAVDLLDSLRPSFLVYDCMDELSAFLHAPQELCDQEQRLLDRADVVFTGGPSLFRAKRYRHREVYCFPSSVDVDHFRNGVRDLPEAPDQAQLARPRLGYFGVIDERMDLDLLAQMADRRPNWQLIMVGPIVKIDPKALPQRPNIHYLGGKEYRELPAYIKGWDVCLMPFAMNEATKFISPTKVLEYMAADKPIVSTPITDVVEPYGEIVRIGRWPEQFIQECDEALAMLAGDWKTRQEAARRVLRATSWDQTAEAMATLVERGAIDKPAVPAEIEPSIVVAGAGPTGLSAAYHLGDKALLIEQEDRVGGWCRSVEQAGFTFDYAGHIMFSSDPYVHQLYKVLLGDNVHWQDREAWVYSQGVHTRYPFQGSLYGLPANVIQECIVGAIEARFGVIAAPAKGKGTNGSSQQEKNGTCVKDCCADGLMEACAPLGKPVEPVEAPAPRNFEEFIYQVWGAGIAKHFAVPYNRKLWAVPLSEMETSWLGGRVPMPDLKEMLQGALEPAVKPMGPNSRFGYPLHGGFQALMNGFVPHLKGRLKLGTRITVIDPRKRKLTLSDGGQVPYAHFISTMPLPVLIGLMGEEAPPRIRESAAKLRNVSVRCVNIGVGREALTEKHWIYYPEDTVFHRIFVQGNASPHCNAPGGFGLTCEITYSEYKPLPCDGEELTRLAIQDCIRVGLFNEDDPILTAFQIDMPYAYVVYDHARKEAVESIREWLLRHEITLAGRYSEWEYYNSDHAFIAGKNAAETALRALSSAKEPPDLRTTAEPQFSGSVQ